MAIALADGFAAFNLHLGSVLTRVTFDRRSVDTVAAFPRGTVAVFCAHRNTITVYD
jgi:hypothetical protein